MQRCRDGFTRLPAMRRLGELYAQNPAQALASASDIGYVLAAELRSNGVDLSFTPVLDLDWGRASVVGDRAFSGDPEVVIALAGALISGLRRVGMACCGKHFPGHGWAEADSHVAIPVDERSLDEIRARDLVPFQRLSQQLAAVMPAHVIYPQVDAGPAGFSRRWLQDVLRGELGFTGVLFSDDLSMTGAQVAGDAGQRIEAALRAGCDMGLVCNDRGAAECALQRLQHLRVHTPTRLAHMRRRAFMGPAYKEHPRWLAALARLRAAGLIA